MHWHVLKQEGSNLQLQLFDLCLSGNHQRQEGVYLWKPHACTQQVKRHLQECNRWYECYSSWLSAVFCFLLSYD